MAKIGGFSAGNSSIILNVYDLHDNNAILYPWGLGFYHSGVQIGREEYTFGKRFVRQNVFAYFLLPWHAGEAGIFTHEPKAAPPPAKFRESIVMGTFKGTSRDLETIIQSLRSRFGGNDYHLLNNNCNSFSNEFMLRLLGVEIPAWINRMANMGSYCSCLIPDPQANAAPVNNPHPVGESTSFYSRPGRLSSQGGSSQRSSTPSFAATGRKLGGYELAPITAEEDRERKEKIRAAAAKRFGESPSATSSRL